MQRGSRLWGWPLRQLLLLGIGEWFYLNVGSLGASGQAGGLVRSSCSPREQSHHLISSGADTVGSGLPVPTT